MGREDKRLAYQGKIQALLKEWGSQIDRWQDRVHVDGRALFGQLNHKRQVVRSKLAEMKMADGNQWLYLRANLNQAVEDMRQAVNEARERLH